MASSRAAALPEAAGDLQEELASLLLFLNAVPLALIEVDDDGAVCMANAASVRLLLPLSRGRALDNLFTLLAEAVPGVDLRRAVQAHGPGIGTVCADLRLSGQAQDGPVQVLSLRLDRLASHRLMATLTDITAQVRAEQAQAAAAALAEESHRLHQLGQLKSRFLATMSHELRTPLTTVLGFIELLRHGRLSLSSPQGADVLARIADNGNHLLRLIDDVLDLAHIEAGRLVLRPALLDLRRVVDEVVAALAPQWQAKGQTLAVHVGDELDTLMLDPARLRQMLWHLLSNAVKFTPAGGAVAVHAAALPAGGGPPAFELVVRDSGIGISAERQAQAFEPFHQLDGGNGRYNEGAGLGLALTRELARAHQGQVSLHSAPGEGSTLRLRLPMVLAPELAA